MINCLAQWLTVELAILSLSLSLIEVRHCATKSRKGVTINGLCLKPKLDCTKKNQNKLHMQCTCEFH